MIARMLRGFASYCSDTEGATAVEYAIVASLIAGVVISSVMGLGIVTNGLFQSLASVWP